MNRSHETSVYRKISVVVPFYNESENLTLLIQDLNSSLTLLKLEAEIILVNDASTDSFERPQITPNFPIRWIDLSHNSGQSAALYYGFQAATGDLVGMLDADLQNDPNDFQKLFALLQSENLDLVTGVRTSRQDTWIRRISSQVANTVRSTLLGDHTSDTGCSLKLMKAEAAKRLPGWNGMHRFIPALLIGMDYKTGETPVNHRARYRGVSKVIGTKRALRATRDLMGMIWLKSRQFKGRPLSS
jgi:glycosyltransferase involved in cell wall biosynthesis